MGRCWSGGIHTYPGVGAGVGSGVGAAVGTSVIDVGASVGASVIDTSVQDMASTRASCCAMAATSAADRRIDALREKLPGRHRLAFGEVTAVQVEFLGQSVLLRAGMQGTWQPQQKV